MSSARSLMRLAFAGLFVNFVAVACVVSDGNDDDDDNTNCDPSAYKDCTCADGDVGIKKCNSSGSGYGACDCTGAGTAGANSGGEGGSATSGTAGAAGETTTPGGAGGVAAGGASEGGAGGAFTDPNAICFEDPGDDCQECVQVSCCDQWKACSDDTEGDCQQQFFNIIACAQTDRAERDIKPEDLELCAEEEVEGGDVWSAGLLATTKNLIDCTGGGVDWESRAWNAKSCNALCFLQE